MLIGALLLIAFAWLVSRFGKPLVFALCFAVVGTVLALVSRGASMVLLTDFAVSFAYAAVLFYILHRVADSIVLSLVVVFAGAALYVVLPLFIIVGDAAK